MAVERVTIRIPLEVIKTTCPKCNMTFALLAILEGEDPEYGFSRNWSHQQPNAGYDFYCPYCGANIGKEK